MFLFRRTLAVLLLLTATAAADRPPRRNKLNMPPGWSWPPSAAMRTEGRACLARLDELGVAWKPAPKTRKVTTPIYVPSMEIGGVKLTSIWRKGPQVLDCRLARALAETGAEALRAAGVVELRFSTIHRVKNIEGTRILSRHALGLAMDVFEMVTEDGTRHVVKKDYPDVVLLSVESWINQTGWFRYLLTPGNDRRHHHDHFHFEARSPEEVERFISSTLKL
jgi:hypothetical protein